MNLLEQSSCPLCGCPGGPHGVTYTEPLAPSRAILVLKMDDGYLGLNALSKYSGLSVRQLKKYIYRSNDPLPAFQTDGRDSGRGKLLIRRSEFDKWVLQNLRRPSPAIKVEAAVKEVMEELKGG
jgi:hypothetical protein